MTSDVLQISYISGVSAWNDRPQEKYAGVDAIRDMKDILDAA